MNSKAIVDILSFIESNKERLGITLYDKSTNAQIVAFEEGFQLRLPDDLITFYRFCNGFESEEDFFRIIPLEEMEVYRDRFRSNHFYLAEYLIYCDVWEIEINPTDANDYTLTNYDADGERIVLTNSFAEFLVRFMRAGVFEKGGLYDWHQEVKR